MSVIAEKQKKNTILMLEKKKQAGEKISMITCYDAAFGRLLDATKIDVILVGDSLGNVMLGLDDTTSVTIDHMVLFTKAVSRVVFRPLLIADMPFLTYYDKKVAIKNAGRLIQEGGAQCVKMEGGIEICPQIEAVVKNGIPVIGHLGLTPQHVHKLGGHRVQGRSEEAAKKLVEDAKQLEKAGVSAVVLELVPKDLAKKVTQVLKIPTIGIGAGPDCDGQVLVLHDLLGFDNKFQPKFLKQYITMSELITNAVNNYHSDVQAGFFPDGEHSFS